MRLKIYPMIALILFLASPIMSYSTTIETVSVWSGSGIGNFGEDNSGINEDTGVYATYGQTVNLSAGSDNILQSISFFINDAWTQPDTIEFAIYLYQWDGSKIYGNKLFQSNPLSTAQSNGFEEFTVHTGGISLSRDIDYVAFMSASNFFDGSIGYGSVGMTSDSYSNGNYVYINNKSDFRKLSTDTWGSIDGIDLAFKLELTSVPEPASFLLFITGILGIARIRRAKETSLKSDHQ